MDRILLKIIGSQLVDGQSDQIELTTMGTMRDNGTAYVIRYTEEQEPPMAPVQVTVRIQKDESPVAQERGHHSLPTGSLCFVWLAGFQLPWFRYIPVNNLVHTSVTRRM